MSDLFSYLKRLTKKEPIDESQEQFQKDYSPYMVNRFLSCERNFLPIVKEMNRDHVTKEMHFDFCDTVIPKSNKFLKYNLKKEKHEKEIKYIAEFFGEAIQTAKQYHKLISEEEMKRITDFFEKRGIKK